MQQPMERSIDHADRSRGFASFYIAQGRRQAVRTDGRSQHIVGSIIQRGERATARLAARTEDLDVERAKIALKKASMRLRVSEALGKK